MAEVVACIELSHRAEMSGKSVWDASDRSRGSSIPGRQRQFPDADLPAGEVAVESESVGHEAGARSESAVAYFRDIKSHGPAIAARRMSVRQSLLWPDFGYRSSGSMRPLDDGTRVLRKVPPADLRLPCSLMACFIPESEPGVTRLAQSQAQNPDSEAHPRSCVPKQQPPFHRSSNPVQMLL